ncbi:Regulator of G-protein signaling rgs-2 [Trichinella pseudospiralis]|uniref:Regulator of G-protein signaling rgs-2 n=1 Tax=Trichinella pseudospiralis TaxID=6337 RepID=A0A0V1IK12_TRIPS|nr:Regulator of G-protein signaling rgs-2 [Trichinella pseudospiralis]
MKLHFNICLNMLNRWLYGNWKKAAVNEAGGTESRNVLSEAKKFLVTSGNEVENILKRKAESFGMRNQENTNSAAVSIWDGFENEFLVKKQIMSLSLDEEAFLRAPPAGTEFTFDFDSYVSQAEAALKADPNLEKIRFRLVPRKIKEEEFWRNYFYRVYLVKSNAAGAAELATPVETAEDGRTEEKKNEETTDIEEEFDIEDLSGDEKGRPPGDWTEVNTNCANAMTTVKTTNNYYYEETSQSSPVRPPRRSKNVTQKQMNQILDEVKSEQEKNVVIDTLAALVTDVNATAQVLRRSVSRTRLEEYDRETPLLDVSRSDSTFERPPSTVWDRRGPEVEYHLLIHSPAHMDYTDSRYSPVGSRKHAWDQDSQKSGVPFNSMESLSRARSETPSRKIIVLEEPVKSASPVCAACKQPILGPCITALAPNSTKAQKYHPSHFVCSYCMKPLNLKGTYREHERKPYCHECFYRLYTNTVQIKSLQLVNNRAEFPHVDCIFIPLWPLCCSVFLKAEQIQLVKKQSSSSPPPLFVISPYKCRLFGNNFDSSERSLISIFTFHVIFLLEVKNENESCAFNQFVLEKLLDFAEKQNKKTYKIAEYSFAFLKPIQMFSDGSTKLSVTSNRHDRSRNMYSKEKRSKIFRDRNAKPCCLCWCCCFSCSLSMQQEQPNVQNSSVPMKQREERPTYEDVKRWSTSFDCLMNHPVGQKMFADFLKSEFSDENILFWQACEDLKKEKNTEKIEEKARIIYEDFVSILSPKEVSLDSRVREIVNSNMVRPNAHTFDEAQAQIFTLMQRDSYPRFIGSEFFKNFTSTFVESES